MSRRRGFTFIELLAVVSIIGILVRIAMPLYHNFKLRATAAAVTGDFEVVRHAAYSYYADQNAWPGEYATGVTPPELVTYLPGGFTFQRGGYQLDWECWALTTADSGSSGPGALVGVSLVSSDAGLGNAVVALLGKSTANYTIGQSYTFVIENLSGAGTCAPAQSQGGQGSGGSQGNEGTQGRGNQGQGNQGQGRGNHGTPPGNQANQ